MAVDIVVVVGLDSAATNCSYDDDAEDYEEKQGE